MKRIMMKSAIAVAALILPASVLAADARDFSLDVPAGEMRLLELEANVGQVEIVAADIDVIEVRARLEPDDDNWFGSSERVKERLEEAELVHDVRNGVLRVKLEYDNSRGDDDDVEEHWEIRLPAAIALNVELNVGSMHIEGMNADVEAEVNVGELGIDTVGGDIDAEVNVGELVIHTATDTPGEFDLETNIGEVRLRIDGKSAGSSDGWLGKSIEHQAGGDDDVSARVNVGEVRVDVR